MKKLDELCIANAVVAYGTMAGLPVYEPPYYWWITDIERRMWVREEMRRYGNKLLHLQLSKYNKRYTKIANELFVHNNMSFADIGKTLGYQGSLWIANEFNKHTI